MKQQRQQRRRQRQTQTFHINTDALRRYGKRTGTYFGNVNPNDRSDGYARWSDYISQSSEDAYIPREVSSTFSQIQKQAVGEYQSDEHTKLPDTSLEPSRINVQRQRTSHFEARQSAVNKHIQEQKPAVQSVQNNDRKMPIPNYHLPNSDKRLPFSAPEISSIKQRKSLGRDSEKYLLELLESQKSKRDKERELDNKKREQAQSNRRHEEIRINNQRKSRRNKQEKMQIQEPYSKRQNFQPNTGLPQKYMPRQLKTISQKSDDAKSTKAKRVTINDKGKIKLPTDSFSADFQSILPPSLRKGEDSSYHKRQRPESIEQDDYQLQEKPHQPMDIIQQAHQPDPQRQQYIQKDPIATVKEEKIKKSIRITEDPQKIATKRGRGHKKEPQILEKHKNLKKDKPVKSKSSARLPKSRPKNRNEKEVSPQKEIDRDSPRQKKANRELQALKKKRITEQDDVACPISLPEHIQSNNSRPQRQRHPPSQYWKGEKPAYNKRGSLAIRCDFSSEEFMEMIGFMKPERIQAQVYSRQLKQVIARIDLKPKQYLYSGGIDYQRMKGSFNSPQEFDELTISYQKVSKKQADMVEVIVDDINKYTLDEPVSIQKGQTFQIKNKSDSRKYFLFISLINTSKKK